MPSPNQTKTSLGVLIKTDPLQAFFYERSEHISDRKVGDIWLYLPYLKEDIYVYAKILGETGHSTYWKTITFDELTPEIKALITLLF